jgi:hypothetical protein
MTDLSDLVPKEVKEGILLQNGKTVSVTLRPYNLSDFNFFREFVKDEKDIVHFANADSLMICEIVWRQFDAKTKANFYKIKYEDITKNGEVYQKRIDDAESFYKILASEDDIHILFNAYLKCQGLNGFIQENDLVGLKKKRIAHRLKLKLIGLKSLISLPLNMVTRQAKY